MESVILHLFQFHVILITLLMTSFEDIKQSCISCVLCTQVEMLWRLIQKLIVLIWLSVHMMTSQGLVCLLFLALNVFKQQTTSMSASYKKQELSSATISDVIYSDRTDLSIESGSGPIQLALARYRTTRRSVAKSPPHCMNAPQRTLQAKKRGKISEKWEYTV